MKIYDDVETLYLEIGKEVENILNKEAEKIRKAMYDYIDKVIYVSYEPIVYERMDEFKKSATVKPAQLENGEWVVEIYIPDDIIHSPSNWEGENKTLAGIAEWFANGEAYGRDGAKLDVIEEVSKVYIDEKRALTEIYNYLKSKFDIIM